MSERGDRIQRLRGLARSPLVWILAALFVLRVVGIGWGLPASDGWDNDGVAPRDFLAGLVETYTPGRFYTYPPVHLLILGVLTLPVTLVALARAATLAPADVVHEMIKVPYMTAIAYVARAVTLFMSLGIVWAMAKIGEELRGRRAGWCVAAVCGINAPLTYYAHTTNLDVPYLFWGCLALLGMVRAVARHEPRRLRAALALCVLAVGTKDQAYALFLLGAPAGLALWLALDPWPRQHWRAVAKELAIAILLAVGLFLVVDAIVLNPAGFRERFHFLVGSASQDFAQYSNDSLGRRLVLEDTVLNFGRYYPPVFALAVLASLALLPRWLRGERGKLAAAYLPLLCAVSFTLAFNCVARRTDQRFLLPQYVLVALYAGLSLEPLVFDLRGAVRRRLAQGIVAVAFALGLFMSMDVDANLLLDPRYDAEAWLREHVQPGDTVETYGLNVYLPRFDDLVAKGVHVVRVGPEPEDKRNPLPGIEEKQDTFEHATVRRPKWIVVTQGWAWRYLVVDAEKEPKTGRVLAPTQMSNALDKDGSGFFQGLIYHNARGYFPAHKSEWPEHGFWPRLDYHASTAREVWIYERDDSPKPSP